MSQIDASVGESDGGSKNSAFVAGFKRNDPICPLLEPVSMKPISAENRMKSGLPSPFTSIEISYSPSAAFEKRPYVLTTKTMSWSGPNGNDCTPIARGSKLALIVPVLGFLSPQA